MTTGELRASYLVTPRHRGRLSDRNAFHRAGRRVRLEHHADTHLRRSEIYLYFDLDENALEFHLMSEPDETRNLVIANGQAVISPSWSIHCGATTSSYSFIWRMGGENQEFTDTNFVEIGKLR